MRAGSWDYIVIGAGSAGCVVASRLSEDSRSNVLLLEGGGSDCSPVIWIPAATDLYAIGTPRWDWCDSAEPDPSRCGRKDFWPRGKVLGGSSAINGTIYIRGHRADFDAWAQFAGSGWGYEDVLPYFKRAECNDLGASDYHGDGGPLHVQHQRCVHPLTRRFVCAAVQSGLRLNNDFNGAEQEGVGFNQATQFRGRRHSSARAYLSLARRRSNLVVFTHAFARRIIFSGKRAAGVEFVRGGQREQALAAREIVVAAGTLGSPQLLMLSGIGNACALASHGILPICHRPEVGENLQEHAGVWLTYRMHVPTLNAERSLPRQVFQGIRWLLGGAGPATTPGAQAVAFIGSGDPAKPPPIQLHFTPVGFELTASEIRLHSQPTVSVLPNVCRPRSRGRVTLASAQAETRPRIEMPLLAEWHDMEILIKGCRAVRHIMSQPAIAPSIANEQFPGNGVGSDIEWEAFLREAAVPCYHAAGTCRMGSDEESVVDPQLRVRGVSGLRVADASVMPRIPGGNTNAATIMIGEKAADLIRGREQCRA